MPVLPLSQPNEFPGMQRNEGKKHTNARAKQARGSEATERSEPPSMCRNDIAGDIYFLRTRDTTPPPVQTCRDSPCMRLMCLSQGEKIFESRNEEILKKHHAKGVWSS
jgi:hypothetical protein